jgi:hypothetical protein
MARAFLVPRERRLKAVLCAIWGPEEKVEALIGLEPFRAAFGSQQGSSGSNSMLN